MAIMVRPARLAAMKPITVMVIRAKISPKPGTWTGSGKEGWREPHHGICWAGTEASDRWPGYFDGALRAGKLAGLAALEKMLLEQEEVCAA